MNVVRETFACKRAILLLSIVFMMIMSQPLLAVFTYSGQNKLTFEHYRVEGDKSGGIYTHEGRQNSDDFSLNFSDAYSPYSTMRGYIIGSSNNSEYRGEKGENISNATVVYETGDSAIPYRLELGDYYANQSRHTLQRGLKGIQLELQPQTSAGPHSIQLFLGRTAVDYEALFDDNRKDYYLGASWLIESDILGAFALTTVNYQSTAALAEKVENVTGIAWQKQFSSGLFNHSVEAEFAYLRGENSASDSLDEKSVAVKVSGYKHTGYDYLIDLERNDQFFSPQGSATTADRESANLQWGQPVSDNINARIRSQHYRSNLSSNNISTTRITGINITGLPYRRSNNLLKGLSINVDLYRQADRDENRSFERENDVFQLNSSLPINAGLRTRFSYQWFLTNNKVTDIRSKRQSLSGGFDYSITLNRWQGLLSPIVRYIEDRDVAGNKTSNITLGGLINLNKDGHNVNLSYQAIDYNADDPVATESTTVQAHIGWNKHWKRHGFSMRLDHFNRSPDGSENSNSYKLSLAWVYRFNKTATQKTATQVAPIAPVLSDITTFGRLTDLAPGVLFNSDVKSALQQGGFHAAGSSGDYQLYEGKLFNSLSNRQVLAIEARAGSIKSSHLMIPISNSAAQAQKVYRQLLDELLAIYGSPNINIERGDFSANWLTALQDNQFSRIVEWQTTSGILRFGIPKPTAGGVRIELQLRQQHPGVDSNDWGLLLIL
ncbi:MAG: hypothetical protein L3J98_14955 [Gammaproteobacteria bacterium]|nr:hypothetical protein [Gammaproteobacteria bacterium]